MTQFTPADMQAAERIAASGTALGECLGDCYITGSNAHGYELFKARQLQGKFGTVTEAMQHANVMADCASAVPIGRA
jgi:hypothetical protein